MATSWDMFLQQCQHAIREFHATWGETAIPFFRGQRDAAWPLTPGIFRGNFRPYAEQSIYYEFRAGASMLLGNAIEPWDVLFAMQHHGLPTRLLDWTEVFAVALHFAVREPFETAAVWMLDPYVLNQISCQQEEILDIQDDFPHNYFDYFVSDNASTKQVFPADVVAIFPRHTNARLAGQRGKFTLHGTQVAIATDPRFSRYIRKFELPADGREAALEFLSLTGVNDYSVFPDLDGLCRFLRGRFVHLAGSSTLVG
jgi:FRG domain